MITNNSVDVNGVTYTFVKQNDGARLRNYSTATGKPFSVIELPPEAVAMIRSALQTEPEKKKPGRPKKAV